MFNFRRAGSLIAATATTALVLSGTTVAIADENGNVVNIRVANITDFHGRLEANLTKNKETKAVTPKQGDEMGAANVAGIINYIRKENPNTLVTNSGDNQGGSAFVSAISDDKHTMEFVNAIGTNGTAVGNHEFDQGYKDLVDRINPGTKNKQLGANIFRKDNGERDVKPYEVVEVDGVKVALIGTTSNLTVAKSSPANVADVDIKDSAEWVNIEAKKLKDDKKADVVIALIHDDAAERAPKLDSEYVDFLFGGDSHVLALDTEADVPYAQSWEYGKTVTDLDFSYNKSTGEFTINSVEQHDATSLATLDIKPDEKVAAIVDEAKKQADVLGAEVVATIDADYKRGSNPGGDPGSNRGTESTANNMIAQSAVAALGKFLNQDIDFGIMNAGGVRADLSAGEGSYKDAFTVQPFGNDISLATLSGATIKEMLENQWQTEEKTASSGRPRLDMGLSDNVSYTYNPQAPRGERILNVTINGENLDPEKDYTVAASSFLLEGGDDFIDKTKVKNRNDVGYNDLQAFVDYLKSGEAKVRKGQKDVGVVLPDGGLKSGANEIQLTSLSYSSEGEPKAEKVTVKIGDATATADVDNAVTDADKGLGEQGRATVTIDLPAGVSGEQTLQITTDAGTDVSMPVTVGGAKQAPAGSSQGSSVNAGGILAALLGVLGLGSLILLFFAPQIDALFGPIANFR